MHKAGDARWKVEEMKEGMKSRKSKILCMSKSEQL